MTPLSEASGVANGLGGSAFGTADSARGRRREMVAVLMEVGADQGTSLPPISETEMDSIMRLLDPPPSPQMVARANELFGFASAAASEGDKARALAHLAALAKLDPLRMETMLSESSLALMRGDVGRLLNSLSYAAKAKAEALFEDARRVGVATVLQDEALVIQPQVALVLAQHLIEAGGYASFVHSAELSQIVVDFACRIPASIEPPAQDRVRLPFAIKLLLFSAAALTGLLLLAVLR